MAKYSKKTQEHVGDTMHKMKKGELKSGPGGKGGKVKKRDQAVAIALSEAREKGYKAPAEKSGSRKSASSKAGSKSASSSKKKSSASGKRSSSGGSSSKRSGSSGKKASSGKRSTSRSSSRKRSS